MLQKISLIVVLVILLGGVTFCEEPFEEITPMAAPGVVSPIPIPLPLYIGGRVIAMGADEALGGVSKSEASSIGKSIWLAVGTTIFASLLGPLLVCIAIMLSILVIVWSLRLFFRLLFS